MKTFKQFILTVNEEVERYLFDPYAFQENNPDQQMMPQPFSPLGTNRFQRPVSTGRGDWGFGYNDHFYEDLPVWLRTLWAFYNIADILPLVGTVMDAWDIYQMIRMLYEQGQMTEEQYQQMINEYVEWISENMPWLLGEDPYALPGMIGKTYYTRTGDGLYQLYRWDVVCRCFEPFGVPIENLPPGNEYPVFNDPIHPFYFPPSPQGQDFDMPFQYPTLPPDILNNTTYHGGE